LDFGFRLDQRCNLKSLRDARFESEFALHLLNKVQIADRNRFRPPTFSRHPLTRERIVYPPTLCELKIPRPH
jgi:hypothetical protein